MANNHCLAKILIITVGIFLFGCSLSSPTPTPLPDQIDRSPFTGIPCAAPCWQGLVIGESSESDVMSVLPTLSFINQDTVHVHHMSSMPNMDGSHSSEGVLITASYIHTETQCFSLRVVDDILTEIELMPNYEIRVDEAIEYLGDPDYIGYGMLGAEQIICDVYLIWSDKQLVLATEKFEGYKTTENYCGVVRDTGKVAADLIISEIKYTSPQGLEFMLSRGYNVSFEFSGTLAEE